MTKQRGGTLLGLIIGALVGLGAALAVAVYITKVPVPFMNKSQPRNPDSDAAEAKKNKDWNPNAPLAGKPLAKPVVTPEVSPVTVPEGVTLPPPLVVTVPKAPASAVAAAKPAAPAVPAKPAVSADPLGDLVKAKTKAEATLSTASADPFSYFIQAGAFRTPEDAEQQRAKLLLLGMQAKVSEREQSGRTVYRVRVGPFDKKDDADKVKERLDNISIETALVRVQR
ncbi:cell division protein FtsN [Polaromonas sp. OV174]|uniref:SPOR domain-containing protein n=1 Tax=Polaromonas sp. OV174 TaxID=1855300 RepID=UPI0008F2CE46|nr:SPOR domain-containing protein [Polaromonas sp. OV174]SFC75182.1 cell division protein FtsN [Polaromonas sp. OV174]